MIEQDFQVSELGNRKTSSGLKNIIDTVALFSTHCQIVSTNNSTTITLNQKIMTTNPLAPRKPPFSGAYYFITGCIQEWLEKHTAIVKDAGGMKLEMMWARRQSMKKVGIMGIAGVKREQAR